MVRHDATVLSESNRSMPTTAEPRIKWSASAFNYSGYARVTRELLPALSERGVDIELEATGSDQRFLEDLRRDAPLVEYWNRLLRTRHDGGAAFMFHPPASWDGYPYFETFRRRHRRHQACVGVTMFETDSLPKGWANAMRRMDEIWVPSRFNRETFVRGGLREDLIRVLPLGIDAAPYAGKQAPYPIPGRAGFVFLSVFQWSARKGPDVLIRAFARAFQAHEDVCLVIRAYPSHKKEPPIRERVRRELEASGVPAALWPRILLIDEFVADERMPSLYAAADAYVLPTRGEGWGLPFMEAMASGLPTIATRWSAHLDFMNDDNSYLVDIDGLVPVTNAQVTEDPYYGDGQRWAEPSIEHTAAQMRRVFEHRAEARAKAARGRDEVANRWTRQASADAFLELHDDLMARLEAGERAEEAPAAARSTRLAWAAPCWDPTGYAEEARHFLFGLDDAGLPPHLMTLHWSRRSAALEAADADRLLALEDTQLRAPAIIVQHIFPTQFKILPKFAANVGRTMFETDAIPFPWIEKCNMMDEIWVPSDFNLATFAAAGVKREKLRKLPGAIDESAYGPVATPLRFGGRRGFNFLSIFDWSRRKGWDVLLRAYLEEFGEAEDVALFLRVHSSIERPPEALLAEIKAFITGPLGSDPNRIPDIRVLFEDIPAKDMPSLYRAADCYVMPSRGEGWGRPYMEAMAQGLPTIGTRWSGQLEFMNERNSFLVDSTLVRVPSVAVAEAPHFDGHRWAEPSVNHLRMTMRAVFENRDAARARGAIAKEEILTRFSRRRAATLIATYTERLLSAGR